MASNNLSRSAITPIESLFLALGLALLLAVSVPGRVDIERVKERQVCANRLGMLAKAASFYALHNEDWILGSPNSSGAYLLDREIAYGQAVQVWDFLGPLAEFYRLGLTLPPESGDVRAVSQRFDQMRRAEQLHCPSNDFTATWFNGPNAGPGPMISYNTSRYQLFKEGDGMQGLTHYANTHGEILPLGYEPRVSRMGDPSHKVWAADGAVFSSRIVPPDYDLTPDARWGGAFSTSGPYSQFTRAWDRSRAPGNSAHTGFDPRRYAYRHSDVDPPDGAPADAFKMNLAFYDTHVERQGDLVSSNPHQWLPTGSFLGPSQVWRDTILTYFPPDISFYLMIN